MQSQVFCFRFVMLSCVVVVFHLKSKSEKNHSLLVLAIKMEAICSSETSLIFNETHGVISQMIELFITTAVSISDPIYPRLVFGRCLIQILTRRPPISSFSWFSSVPLDKCSDSRPTSIRPWPFLSKSFPMHYSVSLYHSTLYAVDTAL
jgi:hypothetical protein